MQTLHAFAKRDGSGRYSLYVLCIILGCVVACLIGVSLYKIYNGNDTEPGFDVPYEQRRYMREVHQRNLNHMAITARRPDMIVPVKELNY